jgi:signal transduction histidine kinase
MDSIEGTPIMPLMVVSVVLLALVMLGVFAMIRLRNAAGKSSAPSDRLSEEAFAAAMMRSALTGKTAPPAASTAASVALPGPGTDTLDAPLIDALPFPVVATDDVGVVRRLNAAARAELGLDATSTGHPFRTVLAPWPELVAAIARVHMVDEPATTSVDGLASGSRQAHAVRWAAGRRGVLVVMAPGASRAAAPAAAADGTAPESGDIRPPDAGVAEDVSKLAGGLAHELANSLTTIHGYAHLINPDALGEQDRSAIDQIRASGEAMLRTIEAFRALVRPLRLSLEPFPADHAVEDAVKLACQEAGVGADAVTLASVACPPVFGDRVLIEEAIAAVVQNAIEAQAQASFAAPVTVRLGPAARGGVDVVVSDRGPGVVPELRGRLCHPFFSDKVGHPGLGLARACHVLRAHEGASIHFDHPASGGLTVTIHLPAAA